MNETTTKNPQDCALYDEIVKAYAEVNEALDNAKAWKKEAAVRMKNVNILIQAQRRIDPASPERAEILEVVKAEFAETEEAQDQEPATDNA